MLLIGDWSSLPAAAVSAEEGILINSSVEQLSRQMARNNELKIWNSKEMLRTLVGSDHRESVEVPARITLIRKA